MKPFNELYTINPKSGCWEWNKTYDSGYGAYSLNEKHMGAHRASWIIHYGDIPTGMFVLHKCDNPSCVNPKHLYVGTQQDNMKDVIKRRRRNFQTPLSYWDIRSISQLRKDGH